MMLYIYFVYTNDGYASYTEMLSDMRYQAVSMISDEAT